MRLKWRKAPAPTFSVIQSATDGKELLVGRDQIAAHNAALDQCAALLAAKDAELAAVFSRSVHYLSLIERLRECGFEWNDDGVLAEVDALLAEGDGDE